MWNVKYSICLFFAYIVAIIGINCALHVHLGTEKYHLGKTYCKKVIIIIYYWQR